MEENFLSTKEAAVVLRKSWCTLRNWRKGKKVWEPGLRGPKFNNVHGRIIYLEEDVLEWKRRFGRLEPY